MKAVIYVLASLFCLISFCLPKNTFSFDIPKDLQNQIIKGLDEPIKVRTTVTAPNKIELEIKSYINRELRSLKDVAFDEYSPFYEVYIVAMEIHNKTGIKTGIALSIVFLKKFSWEESKKALTNNLIEPQDRELINKTFDLFKSAWRDLYTVENIEVGTCSEEELKNLCEKIIAQFDTDCLEPLRTLRRSIRNTLLYQSKNKDK